MNEKHYTVGKTSMVHIWKNRYEDEQLHTMATHPDM